MGSVLGAAAGRQLGGAGPRGPAPILLLLKQAAVSEARDFGCGDVVAGE